MTKRYRVNQTKYRSVRADATDLARRAFGRAPTGTRETVAALSDLDLEITEGTSTAIVGRNGAGKSTALRLASRITYPTEGKVRVRGRVGALIEIGAGVHPELSGRENIGLYGSFLGFSRANIKRRFDEIVDFAEIESSVDTAVKYYSTGMKLRLGFAIAAFLEPAIFIVDESLAVGDGAFQAKCINRMNQLGRDGATIIFVSHELPAVEALCEQAIWLDRGRLVQQGSIGDILRDYSRSLDDGTVLDETATTGANPESIRCLRVVTSDDSGRQTSTFRPGDPVTVRLTFAGGVPDEPHRVALRVRDGYGGDLVELATDVDPDTSVSGGRWSIECRLESLPLNPRMYQLWCSVGSGRPLRRRLEWTEVGALRMEVPGSWSESRALASTAGPA
ncbi:MAG: polysaccharide ABC transporter ATP-binding protein, partial [Acidimicrobiia bacterium]|nr:polysaccharide ABC transporter ATP-binding protein [Acidimicrobiia bacterium]